MILNGVPALTLPTGANRKPILDENGFQQLLAAAYVLQRHNDSVRAQGFQPDSAALLDSQRSRPVAAGKPGSLEPFPPADERVPLSGQNDADDLAAECRVCGRLFARDEVFCGNCGMPRAAAASAEDLQSKWASMWFMRQARAEPGPADVRPVFAGRGPESTKRSERAPGFGAEWRKERVASAGTPGQLATVNKKERSAWNSGGSREGRAGSSVPGGESAPQESALPSSSLQQLLQTGVSWLGTHRSLVLTAGVFVLAMALAGLWPSPSSSALRLTWFESLLVKLGVAEVPAKAPSFAGNPDIKVWVDVHTALYYCPGSDLYGKTPDGRFSSQRDAQQDQFEPATRAACE